MGVLRFYKNYETWYGLLSTQNSNGLEQIKTNALHQLSSDIMSKNECHL